MKFEQLGLIKPILDALSSQGYEQPTPIQEKAIPSILQGKDLLGSAQTGTGKTAAFAIPILQNLSDKNQPKNHIKALILTPTRELAIQIQENFQAYGKHLKLKSLVIFGGVKQHHQENDLRKGVDILVATPGRLLDFISQGIIKLNQLEIFVLDEADRMLDMGFVHDVKRILKLLPPKRQNLFFSATMPKEIANLASDILVNPVKVEVAPVSSTADTIQQSIYFVDKDDKMVGFSIVMPGFSDALKKANGKLFPFGFYHLLQARKHSKEVVFYLIGVLPEYQSKGVTALIFEEYYNVFT